MRVICGRTNGNGFGRSTVKVAEIVCDFLELVCSKHLVVSDLVQYDDVMCRLGLFECQQHEKAKNYCEIILTVPCRGSCATRKKSHPGVIVIPRSTAVPGWTLQLRF